MSAPLPFVQFRFSDQPESLPYGVALVLILLVLLMNALSITVRAYVRRRKKW